MTLAERLEPYSYGRRKDVKRPLTSDEIRDIRARENREGMAYSDRDMLLDHLEIQRDALLALLRHFDGDPGLSGMQRLALANARAVVLH